MLTISKTLSDRTRLELPLKAFLFPGGEVGVKLDTGNLRYLHAEAPWQTITARIRSSNDFMELVMATDALSRLDDTPIRLFMPYVPYGRQDRVCVPGESFSLKAFASIINGLGFQRVTVVDPHSGVTEAVFDRLKALSQFDVIHQFRAFSTRVTRSDVPIVFVSPDAGANKKTSELAKYYGHGEFIRADKLRNLSTGDIKETIVYAENLTGQDVVIADDLCDKGGTFLLLAKALRAKGCGKIVLYITHGLFTHARGVGHLLSNGIDEVYTTNSYYGQVPPGGIDIDRATVLDLESTFPF